MATLAFDGVNDVVTCTPITTSINNVPAGAATFAALIARTTTNTDDGVMGIRETDLGNEAYHTLRFGDDQDLYPDDGIVGMHIDLNCPHSGVTANDFFIVGEDWPGGVALDRAHFSSKLSAAESWTHVNSDGNNGGNRAGPGTGGYFHIGDVGGAPFVGSIALVAVWQGIRLSDTDWTNLWVNKKTSDWWNHPAGQPVTLIELTSTSLTDIGSDPLSSLAITGAAATGANPVGWTFDGRGVSIPPVTTVDVRKPNFIYLRKNR